jgi:hypothetical protein
LPLMTHGATVEYSNPPSLSHLCRTSCHHKLPKISR